MKSEPVYPSIILVGPTGIGKTELSLTIAERISAEIISVDSMQVYCHMNIGTAKVTYEERNRVPHHLIDIVDPDEEYHAARFADDARRASHEIRSRGRIPFFVGGTGLYLKSLFEGFFEIHPISPEIRKAVGKELEEKGRDGLFAELSRVDPKTASRVHPNDTYRIIRAMEIFRSSGIPWSELIDNQKKQEMGGALKIGLSRERPELYQRIDERVNHMINAGLLSEVRWLLSHGYGPQLKPMQSIGYRHMVNYVENVWTWTEAMEFLARDTRRYAKRQITWFSRDTEIQWVHPDDFGTIMALIEKYLISIQCCTQ